MPKESLQKKVGRVRPPRVQITYDVQVGDAIEKREMPFVVGVLADLSGMPEKPLPPIEAKIRRHRPRQRQRCDEEDRLRGWPSRSRTG